MDFAFQPRISSWILASASAPLMFVGKSPDKNTPGKSRPKASNAYTIKILDNFWATNPNASHPESTYGDELRDSSGLNGSNVRNAKRGAWKGGFATAFLCRAFPIATAILHPNSAQSSPKSPFLVPCRPKTVFAMGLRCL